MASKIHANGDVPLTHTPLQSCCVMENNRETQPHSLAWHSGRFSNNRAVKYDERPV